MASIKRFHEPNCAGDGCACPWRLDYRPLGMKGPRRRVEFATKKLAERFLTETSHRVSRGEYVAPAQIPTFKEAAEKWFAPKADRRPGYVADLRSRLDKHVLPRIGCDRLDRITVAMIEALRDNLRKEYAPATVRQIIQIVGGVFKAAIRRGECATNPYRPHRADLRGLARDYERRQRGR